MEIIKANLFLITINLYKIIIYIIQIAMYVDNAFARLAYINKFHCSKLS